MPDGKVEGGFPREARRQGRKVARVGSKGLYLFISGKIIESYLDLIHSFAAGFMDNDVVFSGDVGHYNDLIPLMDECNLMLMESGHHIAFSIPLI